jgi:hypothetical protein
MRVVVDVKLEQLLEAAPVLRDLSAVIKYEIMWEFRHEVIRQVQRLNPKDWFKQSNGALFLSVNGLIIDDRISFYSTKPYFTAQEEGVKPHTMWYLLGKTVPMKKEGQTVFRKCTLKSIMNGGWRHPGYSGKHFLRHCVDVAMERLPNMVSARVFAHTGVII